MTPRQIEALVASLLLAAACGGGDSGPDRSGASDAARDLGRGADTRGEADLAPGDVDDTEDEDETSPADTTEIDSADSADVDDSGGDDATDDPADVDAQLCTPGVRECVDNATYHRCEPSGDAWGPTEVCAGDRYCQAGRCLDPDCLPRVMFAIDGSESMVSEWDAVRGSVRAVVTANPSVAFGLSMFPVRLGCSIGNGVGGLTGPAVDWPHVPIQPEAGSVLSAWFDRNEAAGGASPLVATIQWFADNAAAVWGEPTENGYLVVMTEGADTCRCEAHEIDCLTSRLGTATAALLEAGVRTYVIGYRYLDAPEALNAIASNGGTDIAAFVPAGDEDTLTDAFQIVIDDAKLCD